MSKGRLINAKALKKDLEQYFSDGTLETISAKLAFNMILRKIDETPTVYPICEDKACKYRANERPQGEWGEQFAHEGFNYHKCSNCHFNIRVAFYDNFCSNCGADMRGDEK